MFDANKMKRVGILEGHSARVGSLAWSNHALCSGSKDKSIHLHDLRA
jgi:cell division cycle 20-like protein 1 (cofactor of APC complex)